MQNDRIVALVIWRFVENLNFGGFVGAQNIAEFGEAHLLAAVVVFTDNHVAQCVELAVIIVIVFFGIDTVANLGNDVFGREAVNFGGELGNESAGSFVGFGFAGEKLFDDATFVGASGLRDSDDFVGRNLPARQ